MIKVDAPELARFTRRVGDMPRDVEKEFPGAYQPKLERTVRDAMNRAPYVTHRLANSITQDKDADGPYITATAPYAAIIEHGGQHPVYGRGTAYQTAKPYMAPAVEENMSEYMEANKDAVLKAARKAGFR